MKDSIVTFVGSQFIPGLGNVSQITGEQVEEMAFDGDFLYVVPGLGKGSVAIPLHQISQVRSKGATALIREAKNGSARPPEVAPNPGGSSPKSGKRIKG
jgi:hypothetical protein